ncbi:two-component sensor histidine kinase [Streptomyces venezuelae]|uniref:histidine kinase n=1 Tax=Streptomyces venezuelae TaxID=54571 RepID=A0A5P2CXB5_STRVZ|nr:sensor histidine kinase [Streptomyces venezuelae]QES46910.1 two-component sensor histidine kinase [Streptomyces venezuelae]
MKAPQETQRSFLDLTLAGCSGIAYVVLLYVVVLNTGSELTGMRLLLAFPLAVLLLPLMRRQPLPALVLLVAASFAATVVVNSMMAAGPPRPAIPGGIPPSAETQAWQIASLQAVLTDLTIGWIAATRPPQRRTATVAAALVALGVQIAGASYYREGSSSFLAASAFLALMMVTAWTVGHSVRERREHTAALQARAAEQAVTAERLRIARELHDMVAHSIGVIAIQAGVARRVIDTQPSEARNSLAAIEDTSRDTLAGLRRMLGALRQTDRGEDAPLGPVPVLADLDGLVARTRDAGVRAELEWRGERRRLPTETELSAYRIIQEALTNVVRHSGAHTCRVTVECAEDGLSIEITDEGNGPSAQHARSARSGLPGAAGYGLTGMRERAALLDGEFTAGPRPEGGFRVAARLPVPAATTTATTATTATTTAVVG